MSEGGDTSLVGILPLLAAGFIFNNIYYKTRFRLSKADGQRLFFSCVISGFVIGVLSFMACFALRTAFPNATRLHQVADWMHRAIPVPYGLTFIVTMVIACLAGWLCNQWLRLRKWRKARRDKSRLSVWVYWRTMPEYITAIDQLFRRALEENKLVLICLKSRKVYCGLITETRGDHDSAIAHVQFLPSFSITRDPDSLQFDWSTKTEYKAFSLKRLNERKQSIDAEIRTTAETIAAFNRTTSSALDEPVRLMVTQSLRNRIEEQEREQVRLQEALNPYLEDGGINIQDWVKVIPVTEIESVSMYKDDDYEKWFVQGSRNATMTETL